MAEYLEHQGPQFVQPPK